MRGRLPGDRETVCLSDSTESLSALNLLLYFRRPLEQARGGQSTFVFSVDVDKPGADTDTISIWIEGRNLYLLRSSDLNRSRRKRQRWINPNRHLFHCHLASGSRDEC